MPLAVVVTGASSGRPWFGLKDVQGSSPRQDRFALTVRLDQRPSGRRKGSIYMQPGSLFPRSSCVSAAGIGLGIALEFLKQGDSVVLSGRSVASLQNTNSEVTEYLKSGSAFLAPADLSKVGYCRSSDRISSTFKRPRYLLSLLASVSVRSENPKSHWPPGKPHLQHPRRFIAV